MAEFNSIEEDELHLRSLNKPSDNNDPCFMCLFGASTDPACVEVINTIKNIVFDQLNKKKFDLIVDDVYDYFMEKVHVKLDQYGNTIDEDDEESDDINYYTWSKKSIKRHFGECDNTIELAQIKDQKTVCQILEHLRNNMVDESNGQLYMPNLNAYAKMRVQLDKILSQTKKF